MPMEDIIAHYVKRGKYIGLPWNILAGGVSHAEKWHAFDIVTHVRLAVRIAELLVKRGAPDALIASAAWHDVGKTVAVQFYENATKFHGHAEAGATYLSKNGDGFSADSIRAIWHHGHVQKLKGNDPIRVDGGPLWVWLEVCDEIGKWTEEFFPPQGTSRTRARRDYVLSRLQEYLPSGLDISDLTISARLETIELKSCIRNY